MEKVIFNTSGDGLWSGVINAQVEITDMQVTYIDNDFDTTPEFGELQVFFNTDTWDVEKHGLIYTDRLFLKQLQDFLIAHGLHGSDVEYSEQGMQGYDYVSLDVGQAFLQSWGRKFNIDWVAVVKQQQSEVNEFWSVK